MALVVSAVCQHLLGKYLPLFAAICSKGSAVSCLHSVTYVAGQGTADSQPFQLGCYTLISAVCQQNFKMLSLAYVDVDVYRVWLQLLCWRQPSTLGAASQ